MTQTTFKSNEDITCTQQAATGTYSNKRRAANAPGLLSPNHSKFHRPSRNGDLQSK